MRIMRTKSDIQKHCLILAVVCVGVVIACLIIGCKTQYVPEATKVQEIEQSQYILEVNDCVDKSIQLSRYYTSKGIENRVVSGFVTTGSHAWVEVKKDNQWYLIDPTDTILIDGYTLDYYDGIYKREKIYVGDKIYHLDKNNMDNLTYKSKLFWLNIKTSDKIGVWKQPKEKNELI